MAKPGVIRRLGNAMSAVRGIEAKAPGSFFEDILALLTAHRQSKAGVTVSLETSLAVAPVLACARVLAEGIAGLPWKLQRRFDDGRREFARDHPLYKVLYRRPNEWQTAFEFREMLTYHAVLCHGGAAYINRDGTGRVTELLPITPNRIRPKQDKNAVVTFIVRDASGQQMELDRSKIFYVRGPSWDGVVGMEAIRLARESIGLAIASEQSQAALHKNGLQSSGLISMTGTLGDKARERLKERIKEMAAEDSMGVLILDQAAKFENMSLSGVDAQHLETRKFQLEEICRQLRVFPQMIGHSDKTATYASAEQFFIQHVVHSLQPWVDRWEQAADRDLVGDEGEQGDFELIAKMSVQGLMRGDSKSRAEYYTAGITNGWLTRADAREFEDLAAIPGLDKPLVPLNMAPAAANDPAATKATAAMIALELFEEFGGNVALVDLEAKIGRVLSAANENRIRQARDMLDELLKQLELAA